MLDRIPKVARFKRTSKALTETWRPRGLFQPGLALHIGAALLSLGVIVFPSPFISSGYPVGVVVMCPSLISEGPKPPPVCRRQRLQTASSTTNAAKAPMSPSIMEFASFMGTDRA